MKKITLIMAGGSGKRFWPLSREHKAKQSLALFSDKTLLQETIDRIIPITDHVLIISSKKQKTPILQDIANYDNVDILFEPAARNTAPCVALALEYIKRKWGNNCSILVLPADHYIGDIDSFQQTITIAFDHLFAHPESIGTIGITPTRAETGYGYIKKGKAASSTIYSVDRFEEKPSKKRATEFLDSGNYFWNGGIFLFTVEHMISEFNTYHPDIIHKIENIQNLHEISIDIYSSITSISIDYAIMEKTTNPLFSIAGDFMWSDIGSWLSYYELLPKDEHHNASKGIVHFIDSHHNLVFNLSDKDVFVLKQNNQLLVYAEDACLSASLDNHQDVKLVSEYLLQHNFTELL